MESATGDGYCFFVSPIGDDGSAERIRSDQVLKHILTPALVPKFVTRVDRADDNANPGEITPAILKAIHGAALVVADITGANPNVYYELAIAHAYGRPTIHIALGGERPPFDIKDVRIFPYGTQVDAAHEATGKIHDAAEAALRDPSSVQTPVTRLAQLTSASESGDAIGVILADVSMRIAGIESALSDDRHASISRRTPAISSTPPSSLAEAELQRTAWSVVRAIDSVPKADLGARADAETLFEMRHRAESIWQELGLWAGTLSAADLAALATEIDNLVRYVRLVVVPYYPTLT